MQGDLRGGGWLRRLRTGAGQRLVCFPYAGASAEIFKRWLPYLDGHIEVMALQLPGRGSTIGQRPCANIKVVRQTIVDELSSLDPRDTFFYGHSMGAAISFEVAAACEDIGLTVSGLMVSASPGPDHRAIKKPMSVLPDQLFLDSLVEMGGFPPELLAADGFLDLVLPTLRADIFLAETSALPGKRVSCPIQAIYGEADTVCGEAEMASWSLATTSDFDMLPVSGGHFFCDSNPRDVVDSMRPRLGGELRQVLEA